MTILHPLVLLHMKFSLLIWCNLPLDYFELIGCLLQQDGVCLHTCATFVLIKCFEWVVATMSKLPTRYYLLHYLFVSGWLLQCQSFQQGIAFFIALQCLFIFFLSALFFFFIARVFWKCNAISSPLNLKVGITLFLVGWCCGFLLEAITITLLASVQHMIKTLERNY